jgi:hypothetical protein
MALERHIVWYSKYNKFFRPLMKTNTKKQTTPSININIGQCKSSKKKKKQSEVDVKECM